MQSVLEYCLFISIVVALLAAMQLYGKRGLNSSLKKAGDTLGFQMKTEAGYTNETERQFAYERNAKTTGKNVIKSASKQSIKDGQITTAKASYTETSFQGATVSRVLLPNENYLKRGPDKVDNLVPIVPSQLELVLGSYENFKVFKKIFPNTERGGFGESDCYYLFHNWGSGKGYKNAFTSTEADPDARCQNIGDGDCGACKTRICQTDGIFYGGANITEYKPFWSSGYGNVYNGSNKPWSYMHWKTQSSYVHELASVPAASRGNYKVCLDGMEINYDAFYDALKMPVKSGDVTPSGEGQSSTLKEWVDGLKANGTTFFKDPDGTADPYFACKTVIMDNDGNDPAGGGDSVVIMPHCDARSHGRVQQANRAGTKCDVVACGSDGYQYYFQPDPEGNLSQQLYAYDVLGSSTIKGAVHERYITGDYKAHTDNLTNLILCQRSFEPTTKTWAARGCDFGDWNAAKSAITEANEFSPAQVAALARLETKMRNQCLQPSLADLNLLVEDVVGTSIRWVHTSLDDLFNGSLSLLTAKETSDASPCTRTREETTQVENTQTGEITNVTVEVTEEYRCIATYKVRRLNPRDAANGSYTGSGESSGWTANNPDCFNWSTASNTNCEDPATGFTRAGCTDVDVRVNSCANSSHDSNERHVWCSALGVSGFKKVKSNKNGGQWSASFGEGWGGDSGNDQTPYRFYTTLCNVDQILAQQKGGSASDCGDSDESCQNQRSLRKEEMAGYLRYIQAPSGYKSVANIEQDLNASDEGPEHDQVTKDYFIFVPDID